MVFDLQNTALWAACEKELTLFTINPKLKLI